jgi:endonuclease YncB( thermonuclease family)
VPSDRSLRILALVAIGACAITPPSARARQGEPGLEIGVFPLAKTPVVDGDTIRVEGLDHTLRLLAIDTEETFKHESERRAFAAGWASYLRAMRGDSPHPVKMATPLGMDGKRFAEQFFDGVGEVKLERDHPQEVRDYYDRYLAYVFAERHGVWVNYNVEAVRAGMSPYFTKYGYSRRFHADFVAAEAEARAARRGIWDPTRQHYPDYDERKAWWNRRAEAIQTFEADTPARDGRIELTNLDALERLEQHVGRAVVLLGAVAAVKPGAAGPTLVLLGRRRGADFPLVFFDRAVFAASGISGLVGEYVRVRGVVGRYRAGLQMRIDAPDQITLPEAGRAPTDP